MQHHDPVAIMVLVLRGAIKLFLIAILLGWAMSAS